MISPFLVPDGWKITKWEPDPADEAWTESVPTNGVQEEGPLGITFEFILGAGSFCLNWLNESEEKCFVSGLQSAPELLVPMLIGKNLTVSFGSREVKCDLTVTLAADHNKLSCRIKESKTLTHWRGAPTTGGGTITATANAGPPVGGGAAHERIPG